MIDIKNFITESKAIKSSSKPSFCVINTTEYEDSKDATVQVASIDELADLGFGDDQEYYKKMKVGEIKTGENDPDTIEYDGVILIRIA